VATATYLVEMTPALQAAPVHYYGYVVRVYSQGELQDEQARPRSLGAYVHRPPPPGPIVSSRGGS
jgi:hypothetical protein